MKKIVTLSMALIFAAASFAASSPNRLIVSTTGKNNIRVVVDDKTINRQVGDNGSVFENLEAGYHNVHIYQYGRLLYSAAVKIKPMYELTITLDKGKAIIGEQPISNGDNCQVQYGGAISYQPTISYGDFAGIKAMMADARSDRHRLQIAMKAVDANQLSSVQVKQMAVLINNEENRLDFAKYAYAQTPDKNNYFLVTDTFYSLDDRGDLKNYIRNYR